MTQHRKDALEAGASLHSYRVIDVLGSGAFGITYLAEHNLLNTRHVIKEYLPDSALRDHASSTVTPKSSSDTEMFRWGLNSFFQEARFLHELNHPNIVKVSDLFEANGTAYFVMPYLEGITLHEWIKKHKSPSQSQLLDVFVPVLEGLKHIHQKNLLHRDIKPENIYITDNGNPVLIDFGAARLAIGEKSRALTQVLTPHFAPWEQYRSKGEFGPPLDFYSLAACLYQAITQEMPEEAPNRLEDDPLIPLAQRSEYVKRYSSEFLAAVDKGLSVHAKDRFHNAFEFQLALMEHPAPVQDGAGPASLGPATAPIAQGPASMSPRPASMSPAAQQSKKPIFIGVGALVGVLAIVGVLVFMGGEDDIDDPSAGTQTTITEQGTDAPEDVTVDAGGRAEPIDTAETESEPATPSDQEEIVDPRQATERAQWRSAQQQNTVTAVNQYLSSCELCEYRPDAELLVRELRDAEAAAAAQRQARQADQQLWNRAQQQGSESAYQAYIDGCQLCEQRDQARQALNRLVAARRASEQDRRLWQEAQEQDTERAYGRYLEQCTQCEQRTAAQQNFNRLRNERLAQEAAMETEARETAAWERAEESNTEEAYMAYLEACELCEYRDAADVAIERLSRLDGEVVVASSGGHFERIQDAIDAVVDGATIYIEPGTYNEALVVNKQISIIGLGEPGNVRVRSRDQYALHATSNELRVENISFQQESSNESVFAILIDQGDATFENIEVVSRSGAGIAVRDGANPTVRNSRIHSGAQAGIFVHEGGRGLFEHNRIYGNQLANVEVRDANTNPVFRENQIYGAQQSGVHIHNSARGQFELNEIYENRQAGISIRSQADPLIKNNIVRNGQEEGILVYDRGAGRIEENKVFQNARAGIAVYQQGNPRVVANTIQRGRASGVFIYDGGRGRYENNDISANRLSNVIVADNSEPQFYENRIFDGNEVGIFMYDGGRGIFERNEIWGNTLAGVELRTEAHGVFRENVIRDGKEFGVFVHEQGRGEFVNNEIRDNAASGFAVAAQGEPLVQNNRIVRNREGVAAYDRARGTFRGNEVRQNRDQDWAIARGANITRRN
ncbi:MAG: right-handed parallel beta-helix repeat-containing protein [Idiomarina sp.]|nr:right-handed parallel beta-helix repeat-containing protein [Idiomarina sp.]